MPTASSGNSLLLAFAKYPACLLYYSIGLGAVVDENWPILNALLNAPIARSNREEDTRAVELLAIWELWEHNGQAMRMLPGRERAHTPLQNHVEAVLWAAFQDSFPSEDSFHLTFDRFEMISALVWARPKDWTTHHYGYWAPPGSYGWRSGNRERIFNELDTAIAQRTALVPLLGNDADHAAKNLAELKKFVPQLRMGW